jgi:hypothetical protein
MTGGQKWQALGDVTLQLIMELSVAIYHGSAHNVATVQIDQLT